MTTKKLPQNIADTAKAFQAYSAAMQNIGNIDFGPAFKAHMRNMQQIQEIFRSPEWVNRVNEIGRNMQQIQKLISSPEWLNKINEMGRTIQLLANPGVIDQFNKISGISLTFANQNWGKLLENHFKNYDPIKAIVEMELSKIDVDENDRKKLLILENELKINIKNKCYFSVNVIIGVILDILLCNVLECYKNKYPENFKKIQKELKKEKDIKKMFLGDTIEIFSYLSGITGFKKERMLDIRDKRNAVHPSKMKIDIYQDSKGNIIERIFYLYASISYIANFKKTLKEQNTK